MWISRKEYDRLINALINSSNVLRKCKVWMREAMKEIEDRELNRVKVKWTFKVKNGRISKGNKKKQNKKN